MSTASREITLNLEESETYVCFKNSEGIFVFNRMKSGSITVVVNEHDIATGVAGHAELELSGFSFGELVPQIDIIRGMQSKISNLEPSEVEQINQILQ